MILKLRGSRKCHLRCGTYVIHKEDHISHAYVMHIECDSHTSDPRRSRCTHSCKSWCAAVHDPHRSRCTHSYRSWCAATNNIMTHSCVTHAKRLCYSTHLSRSCSLDVCVWNDSHMYYPYRSWCACPFSSWCAAAKRGMIRSCVKCAKRQCHSSIIYVWIIYWCGRWCAHKWVWHNSLIYVSII